MVAADSVDRLEQAAAFSVRIGNLDAAIDFMTKLAEVEEMFESGFIENAGAARKNLEKLIARRDRAGAVRDAGLERAVVAP